MKDIGNVYRKMICSPSEYQAFALYERLNNEQQKQLEEIYITNGKMFFFFRHINSYNIAEKSS